MGRCPMHKPPGHYRAGTAAGKQTVPPHIIVALVKSEQGLNSVEARGLQLWTNSLVEAISQYQHRQRRREGFASFGSEVRR